MDLGTCPRTHSVKVKKEYETAMQKAIEDKDDAKVAELNRLKVDYEQIVGSHARKPRAIACSRTSFLMLMPRVQIFAFIDECDRRIRAAHRRLDKTPEENKRTTDLVSGPLAIVFAGRGSTLTLFGLQMREIGEIESAYQAAMAEVENLGTFE